MTRNVLRLLLAACIAAPAAASAASGTFTFVTGPVTLQKANGSRVVPTRGTAVDPGDRIVTGAGGMVQLTMVDEARISLRPSTEFVVERYAERPDSAEGAVLSLLKGTLRTFTGLVSPASRDRYTMKTRVASIGIRGSGNILYACEGAECDASVVGEAQGQGDITVNHTIEGSHAVTNVVPGAPAGQPAQQGGAATLITGPGQTVLVRNTEAPRYIPTPRIIADAATNMVNAKGAESAAPGGAGATRDFSPSDTSSLPTSVSTPVPVIGNNGLGFPTIDASGNLAFDPLDLRDIVVSAGGTFSGQALGGDVRLDGTSLQGYSAYAATLAHVNPSFTGSAREVQTVNIDGVPVTIGRYENASLGFAGPGSMTPIPGNVHWAYAPSAYPAYLSDVLTGTASYNLVAATSPTNQNNVAGSLGSCRIDVNFSQHTLNLAATVSIPGQGSNPGGNWQITGDNVPIALNAFFASTNDRLTITGGGQSSRTNGNLAGNVEGSFVGSGLSGIILGYAITDTTNGDPRAWNFVNGVAVLQGPRQNPATAYRESRFSDADGELNGPVLTYAQTDRPEEIVADAQGRLTQFSAPRVSLGGTATYSLGTSQVVQQGVDPQTGMIWGRWSGGIAQATRGGATENINLAQSSLHYIVAGTQSGPVALPLTGTATYDVIGSTSPTDFNGHVGTLNSATLNANFSSQTVDASVNIGINGQTWTGTANGMPIYRNQYFTAVTGSPGGLPNPSPLVIGCTPSCGQGASGSFDGFFTGSRGERAGLMYRLGLNQGAVAFGRR